MGGWLKRRAGLVAALSTLLAAWHLLPGSRAEPASQAPGASVAAESAQARGSRSPHALASPLEGCHPILQTAPPGRPCASTIALVDGLYYIGYNVTWRCNGHPVRTDSR